ncbi:MAG: penicillin-binding protein 2 [Actinomycetota bacterium]|nr:penicillin-binding protein 2 [Actinomycetota bacterium]
MNRPLRRLAIAVMVLFGMLLINVNYVQVVKADKYSEHPNNVRRLIDAYERKRGPILAGDVEVARSTETEGRLKYLRTYPGGSAFAPVTGYISLFTANGLEREENDYLSGEASALFTRRISDLVTGREQQGSAVVLTVDPKVQRAAYEALGGRRGAVVALDPRTGAILAMVSSPSYDPSRLTQHDTEAVSAASKQLTADEDRPLVNRALSETYPPGSIFKLVTAAAALKDGRYSNDSKVPAPDELDLPQTESVIRNFGRSRCSDGKTDTLIHAMEISCNTAFAALGLELGDDALREQAEAFGFGESFEIPMTSGASRYPEDLDAPQTAQSAIGQFDVRITPLQAAMLSAGIANGGVVQRPYLVKSVQTPNLETIQRDPPGELGRAVSDNVASQLTEMMKRVVQSGSATRAQIPGIDVAGKTGTAQHAKGQAPHAWFTGFAPADDPQVAVAVLVERGGDLGAEATGGRLAAPIARAVISAALDR